MRLIDEARQAWRLLSVQIPTIGATACGVWLTLSEAQRAGILAALHIDPAWLPMAFFVASVAGRLVKQGPAK